MQSDAMNKQSKQLKPEVEAEIRRIALDAISLGWSPELLWEQKFWNIRGIENRPGLAACLRPEDTITDVTEDYIEISRDGIKTRFYHPEREFPWKRRCNRGSE